MVQVKISEGIIEGEIIQNEFGGSFCSFKGIPYAEPPIGDLRFKAPQRVKPWNGVRPAKEFGPSCPQFNIVAGSFEPGDEDCLYLNVYTPTLTPAKPLPVMFWIHGGAFLFGSGSEYGPEFLVRHDVILVTINYRLEILGFLCLDSEEVPGNAGMKDQVEAMKWVQRNIAKFGGDPKNVTIFGESAGGGCVSYHLMSPMTKGLFRRAIVQSGSCINPWAQGFMPRERGILLAKQLGFNSEDDKELYGFFKSQPVESLTNVKAFLTYFEANVVSAEFMFSIVDEKKYGKNDPYFQGDIFEAITTRIHEGVEVINGYMEHEGVVKILDKERNNELFEQANTLAEYFVPKLIAMKCTIPEQIEIGKKMKDFYFGNKKVSKETLNHLIKFHTLDMFAYGVILWQNMCASRGKNKIYSYKFTCKSERKVIETRHILGSTPLSSHADDLAYIFPMKKGDEVIDTQSKGFKMIENVTKMWTNFAKHGDPIPDDSLGAKWTPYTLEKKTYMDIGEHLTLGEDPDGEDMAFWTDVYKRFFPTITN